MKMKNGRITSSGTAWREMEAQVNTFLFVKSRGFRLHRKIVILILELTVRHYNQG